MLNDQFNCELAIIQKERCVSQSGFLVKWAYAGTDNVHRFPDARTQSSDLIKTKNLSPNKSTRGNMPQGYRAESESRLAAKVMRQALPWMRWSQAAALG
jgi:hypothetical protein